MFCRYLQIYENSNIGWMEQWGSFGVVIFMLISGYFLGIESGKEKLTEKKFKFFQYLFKKLLRLWPGYILAIYLGVALVGFAIAKFLNKKEQKYNKEWIILFIFSIVYCFIMQGIVGFIILALGTIIITMCLMKKMKFLESSIFLWLGKISYPLYLIHQNIGFVIIKKLSEVTGSYQIIFSIIASICVLVLAVLIYYFDKVIEEKVKNKIRKRLIKI